MIRLRPLLRAALLALALVTTADASARAATWEPFPLPVPPGGQFATPPGYPGDLAFWAPNRGLMTVAGNASVPNGIYGWDGRAWHQLATVCGSTGAARIAWAGPSEFWTIASASPGVGAPSALCRFADGAVAGSYSTANVPGFDHLVASAACRAPDDCWFGGEGEQSVDAAQVGAFHMRWDGSRLRPVYGPQGRAVSDLENHGGRLLESVFVGPSPTARTGPVLRDPEAAPALLHRIDGTTVTNDPWLPRPLPDVPDDGTELRALDSDGTTAWAVGGGANSGPAARSGPVQRLPLAARLDGDRWVELELTGEELSAGDVFGDVAAVPGTGTAWATLVEASQNPYDLSPDEQPRVAFIAADGRVTVHRLAGRADPRRGAAARIACPTADDCWLATTRGHLYRWGGPKDYPQDTDPAFQGTITERPNEGAAQFVPDTPPTDDSRLFAPPVEVPVEEPVLPPSCGTPPRLLSGVGRPRPSRLPGQPRSTRDPRYRLTVGFRLARRARIALVAERQRPTSGRTGGSARPTARRGRARVVARTRTQTLRAGRHRLAVVVRRTIWPSSMRFVVREAGRPRCVPADDPIADTSSTAASR